MPVKKSCGAHWWNEPFARRLQCETLEAPGLVKGRKPAIGFDGARLRLAS